MAPAKDKTSSQDFYILVLLFSHLLRDIYRAMGQGWVGVCSFSQFHLNNPGRYTKPGSQGSTSHSSFWSCPRPSSSGCAQTLRHNRPRGFLKVDLASRI